MINTRKQIILSTFLLTMIASFISHCPLAAQEEIHPVVEQKFDVELPRETETVSRKKRMRKPKNKEKKEKKISTYMDMEYEQLIAAKDKQKAQGNPSAVIKYLDQLLKLSTDVAQISQHLIELADTFFDDGQFAKAAHIYTQYCTMYPGSDRQEYALYRSIASSFACILAIDRDQTKTEETLGLTEVFLIQEHFKQYRDEVVQIQNQCYEQLAASECNICSYYLTTGKTRAAEKRISQIRSYWLPKLPTLEPDIIALEVQLAEKKEKLELLNNKHLQIAENKKSKHMAHRF